MSAPKSYSKTQIALHWIIAVLIVVQLTVNADMQEAFALRLANGTIPENPGAYFHAAMGMLILLLAVVRVMIRLVRGVPDAPPGNIRLVNWLGHATHLALYGFLFFMPVTGAIAWFTGVELAAVLHELGRLVLIPAILLHMGGAAVEQLALGHPVLQRMNILKSFPLRRLF
jgi:cytochrome b561